MLRNLQYKDDGYQLAITLVKVSFCRSHACHVICQLVEVNRKYE